MNQIPVYREQFQEAVREIRANKGEVRKIVGNVIHYVDGSGEESVFVPEQTDGGPMFFKHSAKDLAKA